MAISTVVVKQIDNNNLQVKTSGTRTGSYNYSVPKAKVDEFCTEYKKREKNANIISDVTFFGSVILGCSLANLLTTEMKRFPKTALMLISGLGIGYLGEFIAQKMLNKKRQDMLDKYGAQEIKLNNTKTVNELIK